MSKGEGKGNHGLGGFGKLIDEVASIAQERFAQPAPVNLSASGSSSSVYVDWRKDLPAKDARDHVPDYSHAGYRSCTAPLPINRPSTITIRPSGQDQTAELQSVLDAGHIVHLAPGRFILDSDRSLLLTRPGSGLRGSGPDQTVIEVHGPRRVAIRVGIEDPGPTIKKARSSIAEQYVAVGSTRVRVESAKAFAVGADVMVSRSATKEWIHAMGMDTLIRNGKKQTWLTTNAPIYALRSIVAIEGDTLVLDIPLVDSIDARYLVNGFVALVQYPLTASEVGLESFTLRLFENHSGDCIKGDNWTPIVVSKHVTDSWIANVHIDNFLSGIHTDLDSRRLTIQDCVVRRRGEADGSAGWPSDFDVKSSLTLVLRCQSDAPPAYKGFGFTTQAKICGPTAVVSYHGPNARVAPHQRWSTGLLVDVSEAQGLQFMNRKTMGSGHGWTMGAGVAWNCKLKQIAMQSPPLATNWAVGCAGAIQPNYPSDPMLHRGQAVTPYSLYATQLEQRLGPDAVRGVLNFSVGPSVPPRSSSFV